MMTTDTIYSERNSTHTKRDEQRMATITTTAATSSSSIATSCISSNTNSTPPPQTPTPSPLPSHSENKITFGTCGWSDPGAPWNLHNQKNNQEVDNRLHKYSHNFNFGCVEVDSTCYTFFPHNTIQKWINSTPSNFIFHIKIFGFLAARGGKLRSLPKSIRSGLPYKDDSTYISMEQLPSDTVDALWNMFNEQLTPFVTFHKLGCVLCQFHTSFGPTPQNEAYVQHVRKRLRSDVRLAVEFRNRSWFENDTTTTTCGDNATATTRLETTIHQLKQKNIALVASDDLLHEVKQRDKNQRGLPMGEERVRLPVIVAPQCCASMLYCRVHRRHGTDRLLTCEELNDWVDILEQVLLDASLNCKVKQSGDEEVTQLDQLQGQNNHLCVYFLLGTDHKDQPVQNMKLLTHHNKETTQKTTTDTTLHQKGFILNWLDIVKQQALKSRGNLLSMGFVDLSKTKTKNKQKDDDVVTLVKKKRMDDCGGTIHTASSSLAFHKYSYGNKSGNQNTIAQYTTIKNKKDDTRKSSSSSWNSSSPLQKKRKNGIDSFFQKIEKQKHK
mmetsp:Transcript_11394/g.15199  ORF Transcript_11394/g.15199 Transcript_11394/m.15199 type:complete len:554 (-) Transcript_11394:159-1820(-)